MGTLSTRQWFGGLKRRYLSEVGIVTGGYHLLRSGLRHRKELRARRQWATQLADASAVPVALVAQLRAQGFVGLTHPDQGLVGDVLALAGSLQRQFADVTIDDVRDAKPGHFNDFFHNVYEGRPGDPFRRLATSPFLVDLATLYLGEVPRLQDIEYHVSPRNLPRRYSGSQLWHKDIDQPSKVKVFVNTHDMTMAHGPTLVLGREYQSLRYSPNHPGCFDDDAARAAGIDLTRSTALIGRAGSLHMVDTGQLLHCGSRRVHETRFLLVLTYGSLRTRLSRDNERRCLGTSSFGPENRLIAERFGPR